MNRDWRLSVGYVTVIWAGNVSKGQLQGTIGTVYWFSSGRSIGHAPYTWAA